jgi:hypothetical protein
MGNSFKCIAALFALLNLLTAAAFAQNPTNGWTSQKLGYSIQYPYNLDRTNRYSYDAATDTHHFWVLSNDLPHAATSRTLPRTEMKVDGDYTSGQHQFEADMMIPPDTSNVSLVQVFGGSLRGHSTSLQLRVYNGNLKHYDDAILATNIYGRWLHLNVTHDVSTHAIQIFVDGKLALTTEDNGGKSWYFKCGVYGQEGMSSKMEAYFRNIRIYTK